MPSARTARTRAAVLAAAALLLPLLGAAGPAAAAAGESEVSGVVTSLVSGEPLGGVVIELVTLDADMEIVSYASVGVTATDPSAPGGVGSYTVRVPTDPPPHTYLRAGTDTALSYDAAGHTVPDPGTTVDAVGSRWDIALVDTGRFQPVDPVRLYDSRTDDDRRPVGARETVVVDPDLSWLPEIPVAVVLNVTTTRTACAGTYLAEAAHIGPSGTDASIVNARAGADVANLVTMKPLIDADGVASLALYNHTCPTHVVVDLQGYYAPHAPELAGFVPVRPERVADTRVAGGALGPHESLVVPVADIATTAPADAVAVAVNLTATGSTAPTSYLSAFAADDPEGSATSALNAVRGADVANLAIVPLSADGEIEVYNDAGRTHVVVDVLGWYSAENGFSYMPLDHRRTASVYAPPLGPGMTRNDHVVTRGVALSGIAEAVVLNVTSTGATSPTSYVTVFDGSGNPRPATSNLNPRRGVDLANSTMVRVLMGWSVYNNAGSVRLLEDVQGYFTWTADDWA